ncbi:hypothetical protein ABS784_16790, partial [Geobacillus sp. G4]|uniref:hypothetical protein n=1 Tax=Geobacillus sp. G4 TaxID=3169691 RepID=UPI003334C038
TFILLEIRQQGLFLCLSEFYLAPRVKSITLLSETRDYLIPRLLSGEIDVSKAEKQVEEVL